MTSSEVIRAAIALAQGDRAEARRWLLRHTGTPTPQTQWLEAQTLPTREERLVALRVLALRLPADDPYAQLARETLATEERFNAPQASSWHARGLAALLGVLAFVGVVLLLPGLLAGQEPPPPPPTQAAALITPEVTADASPTLMLSMPRSLVIDPILYTGGQLQITAIEDGAQQVISTLTGQSVQPITGAQFFVVYVTFECRIGICDRPPQATLTLVQSDGFEFEAREHLTVLGSQPLEPVALGIETSGAIVFEVPLIGVPARLHVQPLGDDRVYQVPLPGE
jgi:hypothetical protein